MSTWLDSSIILAKATWAIRAYAYDLSVRNWDDLSMHEKRIYIQYAQDTLDALRPPGDLDADLARFEMRQR